MLFIGQIVKKCHQKISCLLESIGTEPMLLMKQVVLENPQVLVNTAQINDCLNSCSDKYLLIFPIVCSSDIKAQCIPVFSPNGVGQLQAGILEGKRYHRFRQLRTSA